MLISTGIHTAQYKQKETKQAQEKSVGPQNAISRLHKKSLFLKTAVSNIF